MARGAEIEGFAEKLRLALGRANLSRAQLAQAAGVDKSVVARWLSGALRPADHSLTALSIALAGRVEGFSRIDWDLPPDRFAARLGIAPPPAASPAPGPEPTLALGPDTGVAGRRGSLEFWAEEVTGWTRQDGLALATERFAGLWLFLWPDLNFTGDVGGIIGEIWSGEAGLECRFRNGISPFGRRGPAFANGQHLFVLNSGPGRNRTCGMFYLLGTVNRAAILDGLMSHPVGPRADRPMATRVLGIRLAPAEPDWDVSEQRFNAAGVITEAQNVSGWSTLVHPVLREAFAAPMPEGSLVIHPDRCLATSEQELAMVRGNPHLAALAAARDALRAVFAELLEPA